MITDVIQLTTRQLLSRGRLILLGIVAALPPFLGLLFAASNQSGGDPVDFIAGAADVVVFPLVLPILALVFGSAALGNEIEDGTIAYLVMKPVARWKLVAGKLLPTAVIVAAIMAVSVMLMTVLAGQEAATLRTGLALSLAAGAGALAYSAFFIFLGLAANRTLIFGLVYIFLWELVLTGLFQGLRLLSIREYTRAIAGALTDVPDIDLLNPDMSALAGIIGVVLVTGVAFAFTTWRLATINLSENG